MKKVLLVCLALFGISYSVCQGADVTVINRSDKRVNFATFIERKDRNDTDLAVLSDDWVEVNGWFILEPGQSIKLNRGDRTFYICAKKDGQQVKFATMVTFLWAKNDRFKTTMHLGYNGLQNWGPAGIAKHPPTSAQWGAKTNNKHYANEIQGKSPKSQNSPVDNNMIENLKKNGWKQEIFYQIDTANITIN